MKKGDLVLSPLSALYGAAVRTRLAAYERGLLRTARLPKPVISVGNITVGGTGKTPLVKWICRELAERGQKVCVLSRGYGREKASKRVVVSDGTAILATEPEAGDEPLLLAQQLLGSAAVISDANRFAAGWWAIENLGTDTFVLDDGFQHVQLDRDLNVLIIDATDPWGGGHLLPNGRMREAISGLARANCTVITRADRSPDIEGLKKEIDRLTSHRPVFNSTMQSVGLRSLTGAAADPELTRPFAAFCAVGNPVSFFTQLRTAGYRLVHTENFPDHHRYKQTDIDALVERAKSAGASALVTTAKDGVKLTPLRISLPCYVLEIEILLDNEDQFRRLLQEATTKQ